MWLVWIYHLTICFIFLNLFGFFVFLCLLLDESLISLVYFSVNLLTIILAFLMYLFWIELSLCSCVWAFSSCGEWGLLFIAVRRLPIAVASLVADCTLHRCELQLLLHAGSVVVAHMLSCSMACGIIPCSLHWQALSYPLYHQGSPIQFFFFFFLTLIVSLKFNMQHYLLKLKSENVSHGSLALQVDSIPSEPPGKPIFAEWTCQIILYKLTYS